MRRWDEHGDLYTLLKIGVLLTSHIEHEHHKPRDKPAYFRTYNQALDPFAHLVRQDICREREALCAWTQCCLEVLVKDLIKSTWLHCKRSRQSSKWLNGHQCRFRRHRLFECSYLSDARNYQRRTQITHFTFLLAWTYSQELYDATLWYSGQNT